MANRINLKRIPRYIIANTKDDLVRIMFQTNLKYKKEFQYFDIQKEGTKWVAWFYFDLGEPSNE